MLCETINDKVLKKTEQQAVYYATPFFPVSALFNMKGIRRSGCTMAD